MGKWETNNVLMEAFFDRYFLSVRLFADLYKI